MKTKTKFILIVIIGVFSFAIYQWIVNYKSNANLGIENIDTKLEDNSNIIKLTEDLRYKIPIQISEASNQKFNSSIELNGEIVADPDLTQTIGTRLKGKVLEIRKKEGDNVRKGEVLVVMDSPEVSRLKSKYLASLARLQATQKNTERIKELVKLKLSADQEARNAEAESSTWQLEMKADKENLIMNDIPVPSSESLKDQSSYNQGTKIYLTSPINGTLVTRHVTPGNIVSENSIFVTVANLNTVWFSARAFEKDLQFLKLGQDVEVIINAYPDTSYTGRLSYIGSTLDKDTRSIPARITLNNKNRDLKIGLYGKAFLDERIQTGEKIIIPETCVLTINSKEGVFIQNSDLEYEWKEIETGGRQDTWIAVNSGLKNGDKVVSNGGYSLKSLLLKHTFGEE
jgi:cobalt-zinc-cadmium efflux system membrane fusion protein